MSDAEPALHAAAKLVAQAHALVVAAGAGIGVDSGLPDFRGNEGFWRAYPALAKANLSFTEVASPLTFLQDPSLAWGFYGHRLNLYRKTVPHAGFEILRQWGEGMFFGARVFTSNVDGQFQKAGFTDNQIHECHGSIGHLQCMNNCGANIWRADYFEPEVDVESCRLMNLPPHCPQCGGLARPNILMFNDWNWISLIPDLQVGAESKWLQSLAKNQARIVVIEIGAGTAIPSVRRFSHRVSREFGGRIIRINPTDCEVPAATDIGLAMGSLKALSAIRELLPS